MGLFSFLSGKSPQDLMQNGDAFYEAGEYGAAKLEYEKALQKLEKQAAGPGPEGEALREKLDKSREALAGQHVETAVDLMESGQWGQAQDLLNLALELTGNAALASKIRAQLAGIEEEVSKGASEEYQALYRPEQEEAASELSIEDMDLFQALCNTLPREEAAAYFRYGESFQRGFLALNRGDFDEAVSELGRAYEGNPSGEGFIPLELATAHLNLGHLGEAETLIRGFLEAHPAAFRGYPILCEILWDRGAFDEALEFLKGCPQDGVDPVAHLLLWGQTLIRADRLREAETLFSGYLATNKWEEQVARALAGVYELEGAYDKARDVYRTLLSNCRTCGRSVDPALRRRYADLGFESGEHTVEILELYLSLAHEDPAHRKAYFSRISRIYASQGNSAEAARFRSFAEEAGAEDPDSEG